MVEVFRLNNELKLKKILNYFNSLKLDFQLIF